MKKIILKDIERTYKNHGLHAQQIIAYTLTNEIRKHDSIAFDIDSDIHEYQMSVKSQRFTLVSPLLLKAKDFDGQIKEYFERVHSKQFAYVTKDFRLAYIMNKEEFQEFLITFCSFSKGSSRDKHLWKVRARSESRKMVAWFEDHVT